MKHSRNPLDTTGYKAYREQNPLPASDSPLEKLVGRRVRLPPFDSGVELVPEARGRILEFQPESNPPMFTVELEDEYLEDEDDDGLREVTLDQVEVLDATSERNK